jgi:site-specific DNA-cytosine methylase
MERVDFIVSGPPCPPWSTIGHRRAENDSRSAVFQKVTELIERQGVLGCHRFIVEMVTGILAHRTRGAHTVQLGPIGHRGSICCIAVDRDPHQTWDTGIRQNSVVPTLRTQNELVWLYCESAQGQVVLSRCLHPVERFTLQGFRPEAATFFSKADGIRISGNAFTVPVVTHAFHQLLMCFMHPFSLGLPGVPPCLHLRTRSQEAAEAVLHRARCVNRERDKIAILEREVALCEKGR